MKHGRPWWNRYGGWARENSRREEVTRWPHAYDLGGDGSECMF